ncbi:MAG: DUF4349 domain-containing protein [Myxococcota bacterium]
MARWDLRSFVVGTFLFASGCVSTPHAKPAPVARAPEAIPLAVPTTYRVREQTDQDLGDVCKIDPAACPKLDMQVEARRPLRENIFATQQVAREDSAEIVLTGPLSAAPAVRADRRFHTATIAEAPPTPPAAIPVATPRAARPEMLDIEARVSIEVTNIASARNILTGLVTHAAGQVINEVIEDQATTNTRGASFSIRVPSPAVHDFLAQLPNVGRIISQRVQTNEISRTVSDAETLLKNLERALERYQQLLDKAANVTEALAIEAELQRVRTSLERVRGDLEWMRDRVARSTVYVTLALDAEDTDAIQQRNAKLHPGVRASLLLDIPPTAENRTFAGAGLSLAWTRSFSLDLDLMKRIDRRADGNINAFLLTLGGDLYSDFLGRGRRRWLNPYFGFRAGYARNLGQNALTLAGTLGLELFKSPYFLLDLQTRAHALIGPDDGVHIGLQPILTTSFAY